MITRRGLICFIIIVINFMLQSNFLKYIRIYNTTPNTMVLMIVAYAVFAGDFAGASFGLFAGLTFDIYLGKYLGFMTLLCFLIGYFSGKSHKTFYRDSYIVYLILVFICTVCYELAFYVLTLFFINDINALLFLRTILFPKVLYTVVGTIIVYPLMCLVNALIERREHRLGFKL